MQTISIFIAYLQLPLVIVLAWHCLKVERQVGGWIRVALILVAGLCAAFLGWRFVTLHVGINEAVRMAGGIGIQTLFIVAIYVLVTAIGTLSAPKDT